MRSNLILTSLESWSVLLGSFAIFLGSFANGPLHNFARSTYDLDDNETRTRIPIYISRPSLLS